MTVIIDVIQENYLGHNILRIAPRTFLALGQDEGEYLPEKLAAGAYKRAIIGSSPEAVKAEVAVEALVVTLEQLSSGQRSLRSVARDLLLARRRAKDRKLPVKLVEEGYLGYNILQIAPDSYLALHQSEGEFFRSRLASGRYKRAYLDKSVDGVKSRVRTASGDEGALVGGNLAAPAS